MKILLFNWDIFSRFDKSCASDDLAWKVWTFHLNYPIDEPADFLELFSV